MSLLSVVLVLIAAVTAIGIVKRGRWLAISAGWATGALVVIWVALFGWSVLGVRL